MPYLPYISADRQTVRGHYKVAQRSGEIAATLGAAGHLARIRWAPTQLNAFCVLQKLRVGISYSGAVTTAVEMTLRAIIVRQFTVDFTTAMTAINMATTAAGLTNAMRVGATPAMGGSLMGASGPGICTTAVLSGQTLTVDAAPFAITPIPTLLPTNSTGTAVALPVGTASNMITLYERGADGDHPPVLGLNEGIVVQSHLAGPGSGTFAVYAEWHWAEVLTF